MSNPLYLVGPNQGYKQVGDAITAIRREVEYKLVNDVEIRIVETGGYKPFKVPTLRTSGYVLTIGAAPSIDAIISGKLAEDTTKGINLLWATGVTIRGLVIQDFNTGIYASVLDDLTVEGCRIHRCRVGIHANRVTKVTTANNEVHVSQTGISLQACDGQFVAHNSIYVRAGGHVGLSIYQRSADTTLDERMYVWDNCIFADGATCIRSYRHQYDQFDSDWNNLYAPGGYVAYLYRGGRLYDKTTRKVISAGNTNIPQGYKTLGDWQSLGHDKNSKSVQPQYQVKEATEENASPNLQLKKTSVLIDAGKTIASGSGVPTWGDSSLTSLDLLRRTREDPPTIGAYELIAQADPGNNDPTSQDFTGEMVCGDRVSVLDLAVLRLGQEVPCWKPQVHRGYFFGRDLPYYLYAGKEGVTLEDVAFTEFHMGVLPIFTGQEVEVNGVEIPPSNWNVHGSKLHVHHRGLGLDHLGGDVLVRAEYRDWNTDTSGFDIKPITYEFHLREGKQRYVLPNTPLDAGPVVVTDDTVNALNDISHLPQQFKVGDHVEPWGPELEFRNPNLLFNSAFHYQTSDLPDDWDTEGQVTSLSEYDQTGAANVYPYHGDYFLQLDTGAQVSQVVPADPTVNYSETMYLAVPQGYTGEVVTHFTQLDALKRIIKSSQPVTGEITSSTWTRYEVQFSGFASDMAYLDVKIEGSGNLLLDAVQFENYTGTDYVHLPRSEDMTIEYETSDVRFYTIRDLDLSPFRNRMESGFLHIPAVPAHQFDTGAPTDATTLSDWRWTKGRTEVLPWARVGGMNKWRRMRGWDDSNELEVSRESAFGLELQQPADVQFEPGLPIARQGSVGSEFVAEIRNTADNPYAFEGIEISIKEKYGNFPGWLARREYGYYTHLGQHVEPLANERGEVIGRFIPPEHGEVEYRGTVETGGDNVAFLDMPYAVSHANHGNPTLHDELGLLLTEEIGTGEKVIHPRPEGEYSIYEMEGEYPYFGTMTVVESDGTTGWGYPMGESQSHYIDDTEFFMNYKANRVALFGRGRQPIRVTYSRRQTWTRPDYPRRIYMDNSLIDALTGVVVRYDAKMDLTTKADGPDGMTRGRPVHRTVDIIAQNPHRGEVD